MIQAESAVTQRCGKAISRNKKLSLRIDMTPMVDLGFLLVAFFVFTTTLSAPAVTDLFMPRDEPITDPPNIGESNILTALLDENNRLYYYEGKWENAKAENRIFETNYSVYSGLGSIIRKKQKELDANKNFPEGRKGLMLLIKPSSGAVYNNVINALDEALINEVKKYAIIEPDFDEIDFLKAKLRKQLN